MITVVIPLYNKAPHITQTLDSVLAQTVPAEAIVVVDDGSSDESAEIVLAYARRGVRLIRQTNQGVSAARNAGVNAAQTGYVAFLDADDWWQPNHLQVLQNLALSQPTAALLSTSHLIRRADRFYCPRSSLPQGWSGEVQDFFSTYARGLALVNSSTACVRRSALLESGGFPVGVRRGEDIITWINLALHFPVAHAHIATAVFNQQAVNRTDTLRETEAPGSLQHLARLLNDSSLNEQQRRGLGVLFDRIAFFTAAGFRLNGDSSGASAIRRLSFSCGRHSAGVAIAMLSLVPPSALRAAKHFRHHAN